MTEWVTGGLSIAGLCALYWKVDASQKSLTNLIQAMDMNKVSKAECEKIHREVRESEHELMQSYQDHDRTVTKLYERQDSIRLDVGRLAQEVKESFREIGKQIDKSRGAHEAQNP